MAETDQSKLCKITNNSGKDIVVTLSINAHESASTNAVAATNKQLELLTLSEGGTIIKPGSSGTVSLDRSYKPDADAKGYVQEYDLVLCDSVWLYPLASIAVTQQTTNGTAGYAAQSITKDSLAAMSQAISFYQTIAAYPGSQLAKDYISTLQQVQKDALASADGSADAANAIAGVITNGMSAFFKATKDYQLVTQDAMVAVDNYYNTFPCAWAQYQNDMTYYLYGSSGTANTFAGQLSLKKSDPLDITKANGGYTCLFIPAVNPSDNDQTAVDASKAVNLTYANGLFVDDATSNKPAIGLKGSFQLERLLTNDPDDKRVITIVTGAVNGVLCIGLDTPQKSSKVAMANIMATETIADTIVDYWESLTHPQNRLDWIISISTLVGAILVIPATAGAIYAIYRAVKYRAKVNEAIQKKMVQDKLKDMIDDAKESRMKWGESDRAVIPEYGLEMIESAVEFSDAVAVQQALAMTVTFQRYAAEELLPYKTSMAPEDWRTLQEVITSTRKSERTVSKIIDENTDVNDVKALKEKIAALKQETVNFTENQVSFESIYKSVEQSLTLEAKEFIETNMSNSAKIFEQMKETETREDMEESDLEPRIEEEIRPEY